MEGQFLSDLISQRLFYWGGEETDCIRVFPVLIGKDKLNIRLYTNSNYLL